MPGPTTAELGPHQNQIQPCATCSGPSSFLWHHPLSLSHAYRNLSCLCFSNSCRFPCSSAMQTQFLGSICLSLTVLMTVRLELLFPSESHAHWIGTCVPSWVFCCCCCLEGGGVVCIFLVAWLLPCWGELFVVEREISGWLYLTLSAV